MKFHFHLVALLAAASFATASSLAAPKPSVSGVAQSEQRVLWQQLESGAWVRDGKKDAPRIIYVITDPNCLWCHRFWEAARPWVDSGKVQVRHILVGIIKASSERKAAAILQAQDPAAALEQHELLVKRGGIADAPQVSAGAKKMLAVNLGLMRDLGFRGTPAIIFPDAKGALAAMSGFPGEKMETVMGGPAPRK